MTSSAPRYDRNTRLFGVEGQRKLRATRVAVVGVGGLGSSLVQHLALLGVGSIALIDREELDDTNRNRFIGARHDDPVPGTSKVGIAARLVEEVNPEVSTDPIQETLLSNSAFTAIKDSGIVFGCFDDDGPRAVLNELCAAYEKPYFDLASDITSGQSYGGRVCSLVDGHACLLCLGEIDTAAVTKFIESDAQRDARDRIYGVDRSVLDDKGPSVSPINGVVASLAATEFMVFATGMRPPKRLINYRGHLASVTVSTDQPRPACFICESVRGKRAMADVERYLTLRI